MVRGHGRRLGQDHDHSGSGEGGSSLSPDDLGIGDKDFAASGDFFRVDSFNLAGVASPSVSTSTYSSVTNYSQHAYIDTSDLPSGWTLAWGFDARGVPSGDEVFCRVADVLNGQSLTSTEASTTSVEVFTQSTIEEYDPNGPVGMSVELKNADDSTSVSVQNPRPVLYLKL